MSKYQTESLFAAEETDQQACNHIIRVAFESAADAEFDYLVPDEIWPVGAGQRIEAPFGKADKAEKGFCVEADVPFEESFAAHGRGRKLKIVSKIIDKEPLVDSGLMELAKWISSYYVCPLGQVLAAMVPGAVKKGAGVRTQTFLPNQPAIQFALSGDFEGFVKEELKHRKACNLPPFWRLAVIVMRDENFDKLQAGCQVMREKIDNIVERDNLEAIVRGPVPAVISRLQRFHRMQIIVQAPKAETMQRLFTGLRARLWRVRPAVKVAIDIDPVNLL
ncbi:primosomal protein N' [subsurface metagenome]